MNDINKFFSESDFSDSDGDEFLTDDFVDRMRSARKNPKGRKRERSRDENEED